MNKFTEIENLLEWAGYNPFMFKEKELYAIIVYLQPYNDPTREQVTYAVEYAIQDSGKPIDEYEFN